MMDVGMGVMEDAWWTQLLYPPFRSLLHLQEKAVLKDWSKQWKMLSGSWNKSKERLQIIYKLQNNL